MTSDGTRALVTSRPLTAPSTAPSRMPSTMTTGIGQPGDEHCPVANATRPSVLLTDRSTLRVMMTVA